MRPLTDLTFLAVFAASWIAGSPPAKAQTNDIWRAGPRVNIVASDHRDVWAAGAIVSVRGSITGELKAAAAEADVDVTAAGDARVAGAIVSVKGQFQQGLFIGGARVTVDARVAGAFSASGARVIVAPQTEIAGPMTLAGADIVFAGIARGPAEIYGDAVQIDGRVSGSLFVRARSITVGKTAVIEGDAVFETLDGPHVEEGASLRGRETVTPPRPSARDGWTTIKGLSAIALFGIGAGLLLGLILLMAARRFVEHSIDHIRETPFRTVLSGFVILILVPFVAITLVATVIGIPLALLALLAFPLALLIASVLGAFGVSEWLFNREGNEPSLGRRVLLLLVGLVVLTVIGLIPIAGFITWLIAISFGLGAIWRASRIDPREEYAI